MYKTILLAYDGTEEGRKALREGALLAKTCGARVVLVAVVEPAVATTFGGSPDVVYIPPPDNTGDVQRVLDEGAARLARLGLEHDARLERGSPVECITAVAEETRADLVVVGHHRQGALARWLLGSVTTALSDSLSCSLLVARMDVSEAALFKPAT